MTPQSPTARIVELEARIAELEGELAFSRRHAEAAENLLRAAVVRAEAAESALSTAEARGLERAAKIADRAVEHFAAKQAEAKSRKAKVETRDFQSMRFAAVQIADGIRASALSTNEAGK